MAAPDPNAAGATYVERALKAIKKDKDAQRDEKHYRAKAGEARRAQHRAGYELVISTGLADALRMMAFLDAPDECKNTHGSITKYVAHVNATLEGQTVLKTFEKNAKYFWKLLEKHGQKIYAGAGFQPEDFVKEGWSKLRGNSHVAEIRVLEFVQSADFEAAFLKELEAQKKAVYKLYEEATGKAPYVPRAKAAARRSQKAAPAPAETTEAAETTPPKAKAPARRPRRRGRRREDDDDEDDFAPPPKVKADDEIKTAVGEAAPTTLDLLVDNNKMLRHDLAARDEELATARAEIAACKEQIKKKEADKKFVEEMTIQPLKKRLAAVRDELAREMAKNKFRSAAVCPRPSPLCDATNA